MTQYGDPSPDFARRQNERSTVDAVRISTV
jgi:hypothetical protein